MSRKTFDFTFQDTSVRVKLRKVNPFVVYEARVAMNKSKPQPPQRTITDEGPLKGTTEVMDTDPTYLEQLRAWEEGIEEKILGLQIELGVVEILDPEWKKDVASFRKTMEGFGITDLPKDDKTVYITRIASGTREDLVEFLAAISQRSQPTEVAVTAAQEIFRGNDQEQGFVVVSS